MALLGQLTVGILGDLSGYSDGLNKAQRETVRFAKEMEKTGKNISTIGYGFQDLGSKLTKMITLPAVAAATALAGITLKKGWDRLMGIDTAQAKLKALGHDAKSVDLIMESALASVKGTAFGLGEAATTAANAVAAGVKPGEELTRYLTLAGDAAAVAGVDLTEMGSIFNKVTTSNKAYNGELRQLADRGLPVYVWLEEEAKKLGMTVEEMASKGMISSEMLLKAFEDNIGGAAGIMGAESFAAGIDNVWAAVGRLGASFLDAGGEAGGFFSQVKPLMANFIDYIDNFGDKAAELGVKFGEAFNGMIEKVKDIKQWFDDLSPGIQDIIKKVALFGTIGAVAIGPILLVFGKLLVMIGNLVTRFGMIMGAVAKLGGIWGILTGPIGIVIGVIAGLIATGVLLYKNWDTIKEKAQVVFTAFAPFLEVAKQAFQNLFDSVVPIIDSLKSLWESLLPVLQTLGTIIGGVVVVAFGVLISVFNAVISAIGSFVNAIINVVDVMLNVFNALIALLKGDFSGALEFWEKATESTIEFVKNMWEGIKNFFVTLVESIIGFFTNLYMTLVGNSIIPDMVNAIVDWFKNMLQWLVDIVSNIVDGIVNGFTIIYDTIKNYLQMAWDIVVSIWSYIENTFKNALDFLLALVKGDFEGMKNAIKNQMENAQQLLSNIWNAIDSFLSKTLGKIWGNIKSKFADIKNAIQSRITEAKDALVNRFNEMVSTATNKATEIVATARQKFEEVKQNIRNKLTESVEVVSQKIGEMPGKVRQKVSDMFNAGRDLIDGLIRGIKNMGKDALEAITGVVGGVIKKAKSLLDSNSPSMVFFGMGEDTVIGYVLGVRKRKKDADKQITSLFESVLKITKNAFKEEQATINKNNSEISKIERRANEDINLIKKKALDAKRKLTQAELIRIGRIQEDSAKRILDLQAKNNKIEKDMAEKQSKELLQIAEKYVSDKRKNGEMSIQDEIYFWNAMYRNAEKGSEQYELGMKNHQEAVKKLRSEVESTNKEHNDRILAINKEFNDESQKLHDEYEKAYDDHFNKILNFAGLFDEFKRNLEITGQDLIRNLETQNEALADYDTVINTLGSRINDERLMNELKSMGVKAVGELQALNSLSDVELEKYVMLYQQKFEKAKNHTDEQMKPMMDDIDQKLIDLKEDTSQRLDEVNKEWQQKIKQIVQGADKEFDSMRQVGIDAMQGLSNGMESMRGSLISKAQSIASSIQSVIQSAFDIHSPSRWMRDVIGKNMILGWIAGIDSEKNAMIRKATEMVGWMKPEVSLLQSASNLTGEIKPFNVFPDSNSGIINRYDQSKKQENNITINTYDSGAKEMERTLRRLQFGL